MKYHKDIPILVFNNQDEFINWLKENYTDKNAYWLAFAKKASDKTSISYVEAREAALMYGWIDGLINKYDEDYYLIKFTHRRPKSIWSKINVGIAEGLIATGEMHQEGLNEVELAKADGRWDKAY